VSIAAVKLDERICEVYNLHNLYKWSSIKFDDLKYGNIFRMFESDTKYPVEDEMGNHQFVAQSNARRNGELFLISCIPLTPIEDKDDIS